MKIKLSPFLTDWPLEASVNGDILTLNGEVIDLSLLPEGHRLPGSAVCNPFFVETEYVERKDGVLHLTLRLPVDWDSPEEYRNPPEPIILDVSAGLVNFPDTTPPAPPVVELPVIEEPTQEEPENGGLEQA
ncbi:hypothetical protein QIT80_gp91 (endogenous virus) [Pseudomonas phage phiAH14a]|uniref:Uncharacterized protein n=1 Tax=Pseudomonas phage phiAH14a TaxID=1805958 RepID=A0A1B0VP71_9CAUD|nr:MULTISPECIES: hypothetical protein [unclassified Pseudomonas]YP_010773108.1 hypothetical protein QIT80_gp91 [Pseudomonas phage phiAH14a]AMW64551.1 hypothetical protein AH14a_p91 [Pseudomonas phage phiAH14a]KAA0946633.1 hypothetical protein FQ182_12975 [Pseudomonas sp. ANT_H4]KAA0953266.1 hypothetical protein FQ186_06890 [Pseudomonas sp. ANT_H14]